MICLKEGVSMAFGIGINTEHTKSNKPTGTYMDVAVKCWFTATGKSMPLMMKVKIEDDIVAVENIHVLSSEKQYFAGILNFKYRCRALVWERMMEFVLLFSPEDCAWMLVI